MAFLASPRCGLFRSTKEIIEEEEEEEADSRLHVCSSSGLGESK